MMRYSAFMARGKLMRVLGLLVGARWFQILILLLLFLHRSLLLNQVDVKSDIALSKLMHPLTESAVCRVRAQQSSVSLCKDVRLPRRHLFWPPGWVDPRV
jgi:hypothetical protein